MFLEWLDWFRSASSDLPTRRVVVAVARDAASGRFIVCLNQRWGAYAFPTRSFNPVEGLDLLEVRASSREVARAAMIEDVGHPLGYAPTAYWVDHLEIERESQRTGDLTRYLYEIVNLELQHPFPSGSFASRFGLLADADILDNSNGLAITWTTREVLSALLTQHVAVAVACRVRDGRREFLLTYNQRRGLWFFPARRMNRHDEPCNVLRLDFNERTPPCRAVLDGNGEKTRIQQATSYLGERWYEFHLRRVRFAGQPNLDDLAHTLHGRWVDEAGFTAAEVSDDARALLRLAVRMWPIRDESE